MPVHFHDSADLKSPVCFDIHSISRDIVATIIARVFYVADPALKNLAASGTVLYLDFTPI